MVFSKSYFLLLILMFAAVAEANSSIKDDYFLAIKGGISLGSYETGLNRSLLKYIQHKEQSQLAQLVAFSGASAGSINSVLSAIDHCIVDKTIDSGSLRMTDSLENNFMQWTWDIGIDDLVPTGQQSIQNIDLALSPQQQQGSIFSRAGFANKKAIIKELLKRNAQPGCKIIITMSITMVEPYSYQIKEIGETINLQRFVIPVEVLEVDGKLKFKNFSVTSLEYQQDTIKIPSAYLRLVENEQDFISFDDVWNLALASSAFPLAFEPVSLSFCFPHELEQQNQQDQAQARCTSGRANKAYFSDGGLLDNSPIGVSLEVATQHKNGPLKNIKLIYINPDSYRTKGGEVKKRTQSQSRSGLWDYGIYMAESFLTAKQQEYRSALRKILNLDARSYYMTNRYHHLLADLHYHFGAFYAKEFRYHDYLVGIYDGANVIAQIECDNRSAFEKNINRLNTDYRNCVREEVLKWILDSPVIDPVDHSVDAQTRRVSSNFFKYLYNTEFDKSLVIQQLESNRYIALTRAFGTVNKTGSDDLNYSLYLQNLDKLKLKLNLNEQDDLYKILYSGKKYTSQKVSQIYENIIQMQSLAAGCVACENELANEKIGDALKVIKPVVDSYLDHLDSGIWPLPIKETIAIKYGFNISQKNQLLSLEFRPKSLRFKNISTDFGVAIQHFGNELANDNYRSASVGLSYHRDSVVLPTLGFGYQYETKGDTVYARDLNSVYLKASLLDEVFSIKFLYRLDKVEQYAITTRDDVAIELTTDLSKICQMIFPRVCRY